MSDDGIKIYNQYGDPRRKAAAAPRSTSDDTKLIHGMTATQQEQLSERMDAMLPKLAGGGSGAYGARTFFDGVLPEGGELAPNAGTGYRSAVQKSAQASSFSTSSGNTGAFATTQRPYQPEFESPDRQQYPVHRILANRYWRLFYKLDPVIGNGVDMMSELVWGNFEMTGDGVDGEVKDQLEYMNRETQLRTVLPYMNREFLVTGEACPHLFFDDSKGVWTYISLHNPDQLEVIDAPFIKMDPVVEFVPDGRLQQVLQSDNALLRRVRESMPQELIVRLMARQNIPLSPINFTFIPRKLHFYDTRGTSLISRMWRILMYEDAIFNASIATARRHAGPLKVAKLGNAATGWIPGPDHERRLLDLLAQAELDVNCFTPDTPVTLGDGTCKPIGDLEIGDVVLNEHGLPEEVLALRTEHTKELIRLNVTGVGDIDCTPNHKWPVWGGPRECACGCGITLVTPATNFVSGHGTGHDYVEMPEGAPKGYEFLEGFDPVQKLTADQIRPGDYLMQPRGFREKPTDVTPEQAKLLGYYVAEGSTKVVRTRDDGSQCIGFELSFHADEADTCVADANNIIKALTGYEANLYFGKRNNCQVRVHRNASHDLTMWLIKHGGRYSREKRLSPEVMSWPLELKYAFLTGYFAGDGSSIRNSKCPGTRYLEASTASLSLAHQLKKLFVQLGSNASLTSRKQSEKSYGAGNVQYRLHVHGPMVPELSRDSWGIDCRASKGQNKKWWADGDYVYTRVRRVEHVTCKNPQPVINMTVSGTHTYQVSGIATKNSWLVYNYGIDFELVGTTERVMTIDKHWDLIERVKLIALGISKSFLHGEVTYACLPYNTPVQSPEGLVNIQDLREGDEVIDRFGRVQTVEAAWCEGTPDELIELTVSGSRHIKCTDTHKWPVMRNGDICKLPASDVRVGDRLTVPRGFDPWDGPLPSLEKARLLGYYVAEGSLFPDNGNRDKPQVCWSMHTREDETMAVDIENCIASLGMGITPWIAKCNANKQDLKTAREGGWLLGRYLQYHAGRLATEKRLSNEVMRWPVELKKELVKGAFRGDGSQTLVMRGSAGPYLQCSYTTASKDLAHQLWHMLIQLGIFGSLVERNRKDSRDGWPNESRCWELQFQSDYAVTLANLVWGDRSLASEVNKKRSHTPEVYMDESYAYLKVKKTGRAENSQPVYNISVTGSHSYLANGIATYNSAATGLTVFLQRLKAMREYFEAKWIYPKYFLPVSKINKWIKPTQAELDHRVRIRRSAAELDEDNRYIIPKLEWDRTLDPSVDSEMVGAMSSLTSTFGIKFSDQTLFSMVNRDWESEHEQVVREYETKQKIYADHPELLAPQAGGGVGGGGGGGAALLPGIPGEQFGEDLGGGDGDTGTPAADAGVGAHAADGDDNQPQASDIWDHDGRYGQWSKYEVQDLVDNVMAGYPPEDDPWDRMWRESRDVRRAAGADPEEMWDAVEQWLIDSDYPSRVIADLEDALKRMGTLHRAARKTPPKTKPRDAQLLDNISEYVGSDLLSGC